MDVEVALAVEREKNAFLVQERAESIIEAVCLEGWVQTVQVQLEVAVAQARAPCRRSKPGLPH